MMIKSQILLQESIEKWMDIELGKINRSMQLMNGKKNSEKNIRDILEGK